VDFPVLNICYGFQLPTPLILLIKFGMIPITP
jgi:hypothetical protein